MLPGARAKRVTIYLGGSVERHAWRVCIRILERLRDEGAVGVAAFRAVAAIDTAGHLQEVRLAEVVPDQPMLVVWVDTAEHVEQILPHIAGLVSEGMITIDDVQVALHATSTVPDLPPAVTVGEVMTRDVVAVQPEAPMRELVTDLIERGFRAVPVLGPDRRVIGIVTNGDLMRRGGLPVSLDVLRSFDTPALHDQLAQLTAGHRQASEIMTAPVVTIRPELDVRHAAELMLKRKLKRLPVVDAESRLVGMVSRVDLLRAVAGPPEATAVDQPRAAVPVADAATNAATTIAPSADDRRHGNAIDGTAPVRTIMAAAVPAIAAESPLPQVLNAVMSTRLNRVVVVDGARHVLGIVTDAELIERLTPEARPGALAVLRQRIPFVHGSREMDEMLHHTRGQTARDVMSTEMLVAREDEPIRDVLAAMLRQRKKLVPVVNAAGELTGMVDRGDLLRVLAQG